MVYTMKKENLSSPGGLKRFLFLITTLDITFWLLKKTATLQNFQIFRSQVSTIQLDTTAHRLLSSVTNHERVCLFFTSSKSYGSKLTTKTLHIPSLIFATNKVHIMGTSYSNETTSFSLLWISYFKGFAKFY